MAVLPLSYLLHHDMPSGTTGGQLGKAFVSWPRKLQMTGTPAFMAPEVYARNFGMQADMWSLGMLTYQALSDRCEYSWCRPRHLFGCPSRACHVWLMLVTRPGPTPLWLRACCCCTVLMHCRIENNAAFPHSSIIPSSFDRQVIKPHREGSRPESSGVCRLPFWQSEDDMRGTSMTDVRAAVAAEPIPLDYGPWLSLSPECHDFVTRCLQVRNCSTP